jgi:hypothetical protein
MELVKGTHDAERPAIEDVGVEHRRRQVAVPEQLLDSTNVLACFQKVCREGVTECVAGDALIQAGSDGRFTHGPLEDGFMKVVATALAGDRFEVKARGGEDPLPDPFMRGARVLVSKRSWSVDGARPPSGASAHQPSAHQGW